jgi:hypothetical protein
MTMTIASYVDRISKKLLLDHRGGRGEQRRKLAWRKF